MDPVTAQLMMTFSDRLMGISLARNRLVDQE
jgi:hypothetical protein